MATFLDISLLGGAKVIFTFLLVYVIVWGMLVWIKPFGKDMPTGPYALIGLLAGFFTVISGTARYVIEYMTPWFLFLILFLFFVLFIVRMFNVNEGNLFGIISNPTVYTIIIVFILIILFFALGSAFGQKTLEATQGQARGVHYNPAVEGAPDMQIGESGVLNPVQPSDEGLQSGQPQPGTPGATATSSFSLNVINTLLHPKVLAIIAVFLIAVVTVWLIGRADFV